tara:strand:+ start:256 stop:591 length:336 start_codon:yes stop_codon:yes gene_type:complete
MKGINLLGLSSQQVVTKEDRNFWKKIEDTTKEPSTTKMKSKSVSKLLGLNQGMESLNALGGYLALGVVVGLYTGTSLTSKVRRAIIFGVAFPLSAGIIGSVGDRIVTKFKK